MNSTWGIREQRVLGRGKVLLYPALVCCLLSLGSLVYVRHTSTHRDFYLYGYSDSRQIVYNYFIWVIGLPLLIVIIGRKRSRLSNTAGFRDIQHPIKKFTLPVFQVGCWFAVVWLLYGPPWRFESGRTLLNNHETVHLKGIQAVLTGGVPYIGAANSQYGPLLQLLATWWIRLRDEKTVLVMREYWALVNLIGLLLAVLLVFRIFRPRVANFVCLAFFGLSFFTLFEFTENGFDGFFGWANPTRYLAVLLLGASTVGHYRTDWIRSTLVSRVLIGAGLAALSLMSQENFILSLLLIAAMVAVFANYDQPTKARAVSHLLVVGVSLCTSLFFSSLAIAGPENIREFWSNYFHIPIAVSQGYSAQPLDFSMAICCGPTLSVQWLLVTSVLVTAIGGVILALCHWNYSSNYTQVDVLDTRIVFVVWLGSALVQSAGLTRMDAAHLRASLVLFPIWLVGILAIALQRFRTTTSWLFGSTLTLLLVVPMANIAGERPPPFGLVTRIEHSLFRNLVTGSALDNENESRPLEFSQMTRQEFVQVQQTLGALGNDVFTYIDPTTAPVIGDELGLWYFIADLKPMPVPYDEQTTAISAFEVQENLEALSNTEYLLCYFVTSSPDSPYASVVRARGVYEIVNSFTIKNDLVHIYRDKQCSQS